MAYYDTTLKYSNFICVLNAVRIMYQKCFKIVSTDATNTTLPRELNFIVDLLM